MKKRERKKDREKGGVPVYKKTVSKDRRLATQIGLYIASFTFCGMLILWIMTSTITTNLIQSSISNQMIDAAKARALIIENYVSDAEEYLKSFSMDNAVRNILSNKDNPVAVAIAQQYTLESAAAKPIFEGLYIADTNTAPLTHITKSAIGKPTREGERLLDFQNTMMKTHGITNLGIMQSPATGNMVISMYYPLFNDLNECIGYVGAAVYANEVMNVISDLPMEGLPNATYTLLNVNSGVYLYHKDHSLLNTKAETENCKWVMEQISKGGDCGAHESADGTFSIYKNLSTRGWVFMVEGGSDEIFSDIRLVRVITAIVFLLMACVIVFVSTLHLRKVGGSLLTLELSIRRLCKLQLTHDDNLDRFKTRGDEIGKIAVSTISLSNTLEATISDISRVLSAIARGDLTVDVRKNNHLYIGDFTVLQDSLDMIKERLKDLLSNINGASEQVTCGADQVSAGAQRLAQGSAEQASTIDGLAASVDVISGQIGENAERSVEADQHAEDTARELQTGKEQMGRMIEAMTEIEESSNEIAKIIKTIEDIAFQTDILALNAAVEAARAGTAGKGFAVVADEVRNLANKSQDASQSTAKLIQKSVKMVHNGVRIAEETASSMDRIVNMSEDTATAVRKISEISAAQAAAIAEVANGIDQISSVVQTNSATAEESAAASEELDSQANVLKKMMAKFKL